MKNLVVVADDFGFSPGTNKGTIESIKKGIVTEPSLMVWSPGTKEAVVQIKELGKKELGIHLTLNNLIASGKYLHTSDYVELLNNTSDRELKRLVTTEFNEFEKVVGAKPSHINSHQNIHKHRRLVNYIAEYAGKNNIPVRKANRLKSGTGFETSNEEEIIEKAFRTYKVKTTDYIFSHIKGSYREVFDGFIEDLSTVEEGKTVEIFFHPGYVDEIILKYSSLTNDRKRDLNLVTDQDFKARIEKMNFKICNYSNVF